MRIASAPFIKICCIMSRAEAEQALAAGASALGLVSAMPSGPGPIADDEIARIAAHVPPPVATFLLTCRRDAASIVAQHRVCRTTTLQLVDSVAAHELRALREALPGIKLVQVIHVTGPEALAEAQAVAGLVDALLLDSGNPNLAIKELGGTGRVHNWAVSRDIRDTVACPVFLAGGLNSSNVAQAIAVVRPHGIDVCSGVRSAGRLDEAKLARFMAAVASAERIQPE
jgi:phosphoribosylanthranilate isomerase